MMRKALILVLASLLLAAGASESRAVVIFLKGREKPIVGILVRQDAVSVRIEQVLPDGSRRLRDLVRAEIDDLLLTVSHERLEKLHYGDPEAYRDYAEELAPKRQDPEARETAIRLYLIAARLDPENLGRSCMLGLIQLARSDREEKKFRAMAYLLDPEHDQRVLKQPDPVKSRPEEIDGDARLHLLTAVQLLRQDHKYSARQKIKRPGVKELFEPFKEILTLQEFEDACSGSGLSPTLLQKLVLLELALLPRVPEVAAPPIKKNPRSWQQGVRRDGLAPVPSLTLETLTEFDPRQCHFRDGKWVAPDH